MNKIFSHGLLFIGVLFFSCSFGFNHNDPINALTTLESFNPFIVADKYKKVKPISPEEIHGNWKLIGSFFSITDKDSKKSKTTLGLEGRIYHIKEDGDLVVDNTVYGKDYGLVNLNWKLNSENTIFQMGKKESYHIRVYKDTMEWMYKTDVEDYIYFVLVKQ